MPISRLQEIIDRYRSESKTDIVEIAREVLNEGARVGRLKIQPGNTPETMVVETPDGEEVIHTGTPILSALCAALASLSAKLAGTEFSPYHTEVTFTKNSDFDVRIWNTNADRRIQIDTSSIGIDR